MASRRKKNKFNEANKSSKTPRKLDNLEEMQAKKQALARFKQDLYKKMTADQVDRSDTVKLKSGGPPKTDQPTEIDFDSPDLTLEQLRGVTKDSREYGLVALALKSQFDKAIKLSLDAGPDKLQKQDLLLTARTGSNILAILARKDQLAPVFDPRLWVGRTEQMQDLWVMALSKQARRRSGVDFPNVLRQARIMTIQSESPSPKLRRRRPKPN